MSHREFPASVTQATICSYFWAGVAVGVLPFQSGKDWAFSVIETLDEPPIEVIEIATANDRNSAMDALQAAAHGADQQAAGRLLLADILAQRKSGDISAADATLAAMRVAQTTSLPDEVYYHFDGLDDELQLAANGAYGNLAEITLDVLKALEEHAGAT
jgi:hypothetical protein